MFWVVLLFRLGVEENLDKLLFIGIRWYLLVEEVEDLVVEVNGVIIWKLLLFWERVLCIFVWIFVECLCLNFRGGFEFGCSCIEFSIWLWVLYMMFLFFDGFVLLLWYFGKWFGIIVVFGWIGRFCFLVWIIELNIFWL